MPDYWNGSIPWVTPKDLSESKERFVAGGSRSITNAGLENSGAQLLPQGSVLFSSRAPIGLVAVTTTQLATNQGFKSLVPRDGFDAMFLYYVLRGNVALIDSFASGSTFREINRTAMMQVRLIIPEHPEQRAIAGILGALDDKIELNHKISATLKAIARTLFQKFSGISSERILVADLISEGTLYIGDGYRAKNSELGDFGIPFVRAGDLNEGIDVRGADLLCEASVAIATAQAKISKPGDVVFTSKGTIGRIARVGTDVPPFVYSPQLCYWRSLNVERLPPELLYCWMLSDDFRQQLDMVAHQTDMAPYVSLRDQRSMAMPVFGEKRREATAVLSPILARISSATEESVTLVNMRNVLLPKLISGELRVSDPERIAEKSA
jgi:type I restriction enzyme S subunit